MIIEFFITFIKMIFMNISIKYTFFKINNYKETKKSQIILTFLINILISIIYAILYDRIKEYISIALANVLCYILYTIIFSTILKINIKKNIISTLISLSFAYISFIIAVILNFIMSKIPLISEININGIDYLIVGIIQILLLCLFFRIRRFKNGFAFLNNNKPSKNNFIGISICILIVVLSIIIGNDIKDIWIDTMCITVIILGVLYTIYWIRKSITKYYKEKMKDRTIEIKNKELQEKEEIINNLKLELSNVLEINHKYNHRISAMEKAIGKFGDKLSFNEEFANEYSDILDTLKEFSTEYKKEFEEFNTLPKTNIFSIDNLLEYMKAETLRSNIEFELCLNTNVEEIIKRHISKNKLETLLADHITDAIIAINSSDNSNRKIKVVINKDKELYKISILDTGIEFEIETLLKLGLERITTHKDTGGTGIGFMTTFKTLDECRASLIIEEYNKEKEIYTKSINILFDGKKRYSINSYRIDKIRMQNKENRNINLDNK